jgi:hypothetical protein
MSIKVLWGPNGPYAEAETAGEALELIRLGSNGCLDRTKKEVSKSAPQPPNPEISGIPEWKTETSFDLVVREINDRARKFLRLLVPNEHGVQGEVFAEQIRERSQVFGGVLGGISKIAKNHHLKLEDLVVSEMRFEGSRRFRFLAPGKLLLKYGGKLLTKVEAPNSP